VTQIYNILPEHLEPHILEQIIYPSLELECFWTDDWSPEIFRRFLLAGFLSISAPLPDRMPVLLAQLHAEYSMLDWPNLHLSRKVKRLVRSGALRERGVHLRFTENVNTVCSGIRRSYGDRTWMTPRYAQLLANARCAGPPEVRSVATEMRDRDGRLLGGEIGYCIGAVYTSLSGFLERDAPDINHYGKVQLAALGKVLEQCGYAFWNLGESTLQYKVDLGAVRTPRPEFLPRWREATQRMPVCALVNLVGQRLPCDGLLEHFRFK